MNAQVQNKMEKELVTITKEEYERLLDDSFWRHCLEIGGVDNWEWYSESLNDGGYYDEDEE